MVVGLLGGKPSPNEPEAVKGPGLKELKSRLTIVVMSDSAILVSLWDGRTKGGAGNSQRTKGNRVRVCPTEEVKINIGGGAEQRPVNK